MEKNMNQKWILLLILAAAAVSPGRAQDISLNASPIRVEHHIKQGQKGTDVIKLSNTGIKPVRLKVSVEDWTLAANGTPLFMKPAGLPFSCASWIGTNPVDFRIDPKQTREIRYSLACPPEVPDGGYRAAIIFSSVADAKPGERTASVTIQSRLAVILYERVGSPQVSGRLESLKTRTRRDGVDFLLEITNSGAVFFRTKGKITVNDAGGNKVFELTAPNDPVLQNIRRILEVPYTGPLAKGTYSIQAVLDIGAKELIGAQATLIVSEDIGKK